jgi:lysophospholipase L1-like esterase
VTAVIINLFLVGFPGVGQAAHPLSDGGARLRIYPLGDSITLGVSTDMPTRYSPGGYRSALDALLSDERIRHLFVGTRQTNSSPSLEARGQDHHDGHSGFRIDQVSTDLDGQGVVRADESGYWLTGTPEHAAIYPNVVIIHLGTNDIAQWYDPGVHYPTPSSLADYSDPAQRAQFVADLRLRLKALVDKIIALRPSAQIILSSIVPMETNIFEPVTRDYANAVRIVVDREQMLHRSVYFADVYHRFVTESHGQTVLLPGLMSSGGIHPTPAGYQAMAEVYQAAVRAAVR